MKCPDCGFNNIAGADECEACSAPLVNVPDHAPKRGMEKRLLEGTVKDLSPKPAKILAPASSLAQAVETMQQEQIGCVLALEGGACVGMLSERDLILNVSETLDLSKTPVRQVMSANPECLREDDEMAVAFQQMVLSGHLHLPVRLKGGDYAVVSARDLLRYLCK